MTAQTRLPVSIAKPQPLTGGDDRPETPCTIDLQNRRLAARLEGRKHIEPTPFDILHDHSGGPIYNRARSQARAMCNDCPFGPRGDNTCHQENADEDWVKAMRAPNRPRPKLGPGALAECGTYSGWTRHMRDKTPACDPCAEARRTYMRDYRARVKEDNDAA